MARRAGGARSDAARTRACGVQRRPPPLAIGIDVALIALLAGEFEAAVIARFLADWTRRPAYLAAVARGDVRRDLDGCPTECPGRQRPRIRSGIARPARGCAMSTARPNPWDGTTITKLTANPFRLADRVL